MIQPSYDQGLIAQVAADLDLRAPNRDAIQTIALRVSEHFAAETPTLPYEGVIDVATGVGKTYVLAAAIDYYAAQGFRDFAIVTPGRTVTRKTIANFTAGSPKSLLGGMETTPLVVTAENFSSPAIATAMDDPEIVKVYVFTVQALLKPTTKMGRKTHDFDEDLGESFYARLRAADGLVVLADEHHLYGGREFAAAVRGLEPQMLLGFTATPIKGSPIIFRYPLAAAIADRYVKKPAIVGRRDDRADALTKLQDGVRLLTGKRIKIDQYRELHPEAPVINPVMLVICADTEDADEVDGILRSDSFEGGAFKDAILTVHSKAVDLDAQLERLDNVEDPDSPVRVIVAVGMLKEGWDVKNVYVIASLRASVSQILTEQTLGRGLRLPFGRYTGIEMLDTLEVLAHERYDALIKQLDRVSESFIDFRTAMRADATGPEVTTTYVALPVADVGDRGVSETAAPFVTTLNARLEHAEAETSAAPVVLTPREDLSSVALPVVSGQQITNPFSLNDIIDLEPFRAEGRRIATAPVERLRRTLVEGKVVQATDGAREVHLERRASTEDLVSPVVRVPIEVGTARIRDGVLAAGVVPARTGEPVALGRILEVFLSGLGANADEFLSAYPDRAINGIVARIRDAQRSYVPKPSFAGEVRLEPFSKVREGRPTVVTDQLGPFSRGVGYGGFTKSLFTQDWFDSEPERAVANMLDDAPDVALWLRLQRGDLPLPWRSPNENYNPDFVVVGVDATHWVVEVKRDDDAERADVLAKREAAKRWANHVSAATGQAWLYLFALEADIKAAKGTWSVLKTMGAER